MEEQGVTPAEVIQEEEAAQEPERPSKDLLEKTWDFFASVPVAVVLIFVIAAASVAGSLIPQEGMYGDWRPPQDFYPWKYGPVWGNFLFKTGMTRMYTSWWFMTMLFMLGASLVVCSLERFIPLWRAVQRPNPTPPESFVKHLKNRFEVPVSDKAKPLAALAGALKARRYTVIEKDGRLYADKGRWGRWGPYILHIGLILVLAGAMMRAIPGAYMDQFLWVRDGEIAKVPGADWYVRNDQFRVEMYDSGMPKSYETDAVVIDGGAEVAKKTIAMNIPLAHKSVELYQSSYKRELGKATVALVERQGGKTVGTFEMNLVQPEAMYTVGDYKVKVKDYFPDFAIENNKPVSRSSEIQNPGVVLDVITPDGKSYANWYFVLYPQMEFDNTTPIKLQTVDMAETYTTGLKVKKDLGIPVIYLGLLITSLGACLTFYLAHKRFWALVEGGKVVVGGWANRNQGGFQTDMALLAKKLDPSTAAKFDLMMEGEER